MNETNNNRTRRVVMRRAKRSQCRMQADAMQQQCLAARARRACFVTASRRAPPDVALGADRSDPRSDRLSRAEPLLFVSGGAADGLACAIALPGHDAARRLSAARPDPGPVAMGQQAVARVWRITMRPHLAFPTPFVPDASEPGYTSEADDPALPMRRVALTARHRAGDGAGPGRVSCAEAGSSRQVTPAPWQAHTA